MDKSIIPTAITFFHSKNTINGKVCNFIIDKEISENLIAEEVITKLSLAFEPHLAPYRLAWLQQEADVMVATKKYA